MLSVIFYFQFHLPFLLHPERDQFLWDERNREVFTEKAFLNCFFKILVGGDNHPDVDFKGGLAADGIELLILEHAQHFGLEGRRHAGDLVQENRSAVGLHEQSGPALHRAGK